MTMTEPLDTLVCDSCRLVVGFLDQALRYHNEEATDYFAQASEAIADVCPQNALPFDGYILAMQALGYRVEWVREDSLP